MSIEFQLTDVMEARKALEERGFTLVGGGGVHPNIDEVSPEYPWIYEDRDQTGNCPVFCAEFDHHGGNKMTLLNQDNSLVAEYHSQVIEILKSRQLIKS